MTYEAWMKRVDAIISSRLGGLTSDDLADGPSRDHFDDGSTPEEYADWLLIEEGLSGEEDYNYED